MIKVIIVAEEDTHAFLSERYPNWDTQVPVTSVQGMWDGLSDGRLSTESKIIIISDHYRDQTQQSNEMELAVATMAPSALVIVIVWDDSSPEVIEARINDVALANGLPISKVYFMSAQTPESDIDAAIEDYERSKSDQGVELSPTVLSEDVGTTSRRAVDDGKRNGMILASTSSKGGAGKSSTALLLASQIAQSSQRSVELGRAQRPLDICIVDMDIRDGQIGFLIGQTTPTALNIRIMSEWTPETIRPNLVYDDHLGIHALLAPRRPRSSEDTPPQFYQEVILQLKTMFDVVILDTSVNYLDPLLEHVCYPLADAILFVTDLGIASVFGMSRWFQEVTSPRDEHGLGGMGIDSSKIGLVVNKSMSGVRMDKDRVTQAAMGAPLLAAIPSRPEQFAQAGNSNRLDLLLKDADIGNAFFRLASAIMGNRYELSPLVEAAAISDQTRTGSTPAAATKRVGAVPVSKTPVTKTSTGRYPGYRGTETEAPKKKRGLFGR